MKKKSKQTVGSRPEVGPLLPRFRRLAQRVSERFPDRGISERADELEALAIRAETRVRKVARPVYTLRLLALLLAAGLLFAVGAAIYVFAARPAETPTLPEIIGLADAGCNVLLVMGLVLLFLFSLERRFRRARVHGELHHLMSLVLVVDAAQQDKDPSRVMGGGCGNTESSPEAGMDAAHLERYLDYCGELVSGAKLIGYAYMAAFCDQEVIRAASELGAAADSVENKTMLKRQILLQGRQLSAVETAAQESADSAGAADAGAQ